MRLFRKYYYIVIKKDGQDWLWKVDVNNEKEARNKAFQKLKGHLFDIHVSNHSDQAKATQEYKAKKLELTGNFEDSIKRVKHTDIELAEDNETI